MEPTIPWRGRIMVMSAISGGDGLSHLILMSLTGFEPAFSVFFRPKIVLVKTLRHWYRLLVWVLMDFTVNTATCFICHEILNCCLPNLVRVAAVSSLHRQTDATSAPWKIQMPYLNYVSGRLLCELNFSFYFLKAFLKFRTLKCREWSGWITF